MSVPDGLTRRMGNWVGVNRLWLMPEQEPLSSDSTAMLGQAAGDRFASLVYTWSYDGKPQEGLILLSVDDSGEVDAAWVDSFHMGHKLMTCKGSVDADGRIDMKGAYAAPPDPDWGWRTVIEAGSGDDAFSLVMYNITPSGEEFLAVEMEYARG